MRNYVTDPRILEAYVAETLSLLSSPRKRQRKTLKEKWSVVDDYFHRRHLMSESKRLLVEFEFKALAQKAWNGLQNMASYAGKKLLDGGVWLKQAASSMSKEAYAIMKKVAGKLQEIVIYCIKSLPGGEVILEFLTQVAVNLKEKFAEMKAAVGKQVKEFVDGAKKKIIDFFFKYIINDEEMKKDFYSAAGISEEDLQSLQTETRKLGIKTINELNMHLEVSEKVRKILNEEGEQESDLDKVADSLKKKTGIKDAEDAAKVLGFIENKKADGSEDVNPEQFMRGKAAKVMEELIEFWLKLVEKDPQKYHEPFYKSGFFKTFGETGFGLASATILGILGAAKLEWKQMVQYVTAMVRGFKGGKNPPPGARTDRAGAHLFLGNQGNNYDASLFKNFITGIIEGSNVEVIIRALLGDASKIPELCKRLIGTIINAVKQKINDVTPTAIQNVTGEPVSDEHEDEVNEKVGDYVDKIFAV